MTEGGITKDIEKRLFGPETSYLDSNSQVSSNSLSLESFWGLFLIAGVASGSALIIFASMFLYEQRHILMNSDIPIDSKWKRIREIFRIYDRKDLSSHTFKKKSGEVNGRRGADDHDHVDGAGDVVVLEGSPDTNFHPSPSTYSIHADSDMVFLGEQDTPSRDFDFLNQALNESANELTFANQESTPENN